MNLKQTGDAEENLDSQKSSLTFSDIQLSLQLFGEHNSNLKRIADSLDVKINTRGNTVFIIGDEISRKLTQNILNQLYGLLKDNYPIYPNDVDFAIRVLSENDRANLKDIFLDTIFITSKKRSITPKSPTQKEYIDAIRGHDIVFGIGPAGTGQNLSGNGNGGSRSDKRVGFTNDLNPGPPSKQEKHSASCPAIWQRK